MNILYLTTHMNPGGITRYLLTLTQGLRDRHDIWLAAADGAWREELLQAGARLVMMPWKTKSELSWRLHSSWPQLCRLIQEQRIDLIHAQTRVTQVAAAALSALTGVRVLTTCHGYFRRRWHRRLFPCWGEKVIAISSAVAEHLEKDWGVDPVRIVRIPHGVAVPDQPVWETQIQGLRAAWQLEGGPFVGILGRLSDVKGHAILLQAAVSLKKEFPHLKVLIFGEGREEKHLKRLAKALDLESTVQWIPQWDRDEDVMLLCDVFVMPSLQEGLGLAVLEAMAAGLPVVASAVGGLKDCVADGKTGFGVPPGDPDALAERCAVLLRDPDLRRQMGIAGRERVKEHFSLAMMTERTEACYAEMVNR